MNNYEYLKEHKSVIARLNRSGLCMSDVGYIELYERFLEVVAECGSRSAAVAVVAEEYPPSIRTVWDIVKRMEYECK